MEIFSSMNELSLAAKIYFVTAVAATAFLVIQIILSLIGFDHGHGDMDHDIHHDFSDVSGVAFFSIRALVAFFCLFGWTGYICVQAGLWPFLSIIPAFLAGTAALVCVAYLLHFFYSLSESGTVQVSDAISEIGTVYLTIPEGKNATGAVNVSVGGAIREYRAVSEEGTEIKTGAKVEVVGTLDPRTLIVREVRQPSEWMEEGLS
ncbi:hypothetical protein ACFL9U_01195 [Thermodesulfobacteriota bacterium]